MSYQLTFISGGGRGCGHVTARRDGGQTKERCSCICKCDATRGIWTISSHVCDKRTRLTQKDDLFLTLNRAASVPKHNQRINTPSHNLLFVTPSVFTFLLRCISVYFLCLQLKSKHGKSRKDAAGDHKYCN